MSRWDLTPSTPISFDDLDDLTPRLDLRDQRADAAGGATTDRAAAYGIDTRPDDPPEGERWSTWEDATHGPHPLPDWVITAHGAVEQDLGILKSGKEADVHVIRRWLPDGSDTPAHDSYLAAKRFRSGEHRLFHRDAGYLEGRRVRRSREMRAMAKRTTFGREVISGQWSAAEFFALGTLWQLGIPVPYPVQLSGTEMLMEFIGTDGVAAPRPLPPARRGRSYRTFLNNSATRCSRWRRRGGPMATCPRSTSCFTRIGSCSSIGRKSSMSSATRRGSSFCAGTPTTWQRGSGRRDSS